LKNKLNKKYLSISLTAVMLISILAMLSPVMSNESDAWEGVVNPDSLNLNSIEEVPTAASSQINTESGATSKNCRVGSLRSDRVAYGSLFEFKDGTAYDAARTELSDPDNFGLAGVVDCEFTLLTPIYEITAANLEGTDIFWAGLLMESNPLTASEQQILLDFVKDGGILVIIADVGHTYSTGPNSVAAPFNVHWDSVSWINENPVITYLTHPIINGPFGSVGTIGHATEGSIDNLGLDAAEIANNVNGVSIAWIEPGKLGDNSGPVLFFSDANEFTSNPTPWGPGIDLFDNRILFRNLFAFFCNQIPNTDPIPATFDITPETLNLKSNGEWITGYIELPECYDVNDISLSTILLINQSGEIITPVDLTAPVTYGDYDNDGISDLMIKFNRTIVVDYFNAKDVIDDGTGIDYYVDLTITGKLIDETPFEGWDTIRVIKKGK
jgi:hypothetical protein